MLLVAIVMSIILVSFIYIHTNRPAFIINNIEVRDFAYWLNGPDLEKIKDTEFDLVIIDYSSDGNDTNAFTEDEITALKESKSDGRIVLAYLSIGEAENYRYYWNSSWDKDEDGIPDEDAPDWLREENSEWAGNYAVEYWNPEWQSIIFGSEDSYLDKIIAAGFDGVMLDKVDSFEYFEDEIENADLLMIDFVLSIIDYAKSKNPDFLIFPQNGEALLENETYVNAISGIVKEDLYFNGNSFQPENTTDSIIDLLNNVLDDDKPVLIVEYPTLYPLRVMAYLNAYTDGFLIYVGLRALNGLETTFPFYP